MAVTLNKPAFEHAKTLVLDGRFVFDDRDAWSEHQPSAAEENRFIEAARLRRVRPAGTSRRRRGRRDTKGHYKFPYGDFDKVHRCGLLAAESRAGQRKYYDIELAVAHLHGMIDALRQSSPRR